MVLESPGAMPPRALETRHHSASPGRHLSAGFWIPREVPCRCCKEMATMQATERVDDDEIVVRYDCPDCGWRQARHFIEREMDSVDAI